MAAPLVGHLGKQVFAKFVEFNIIVGMSAILVIHSKISLLNKLMPAQLKQYTAKWPLL